MRVLELFAGIGGFAAAFPDLQIVAAVDINRSAREIYTDNFKHRYLVKEITSIPLEWYSQTSADIWWMSPPCTPFTKRGAKRDLNDPRADALKHLIHSVATIRPSLVVLENVIGFESSHAFLHLTERWLEAGYHIQMRTMCPSTLSWPNRRPRVYCIASLKSLPEQHPQPEQHSHLIAKKPTTISEFMDHNITRESHPTLWLEEKTVERYFHAMDRVALSNGSAVTACFAASYGKSIVRSGSYLQTTTGYRRFSPREVARLLGFNEDFRLPSTISMERQWHLLGNSLSLPAVRHVMAGLF